jgi:hypothetical protein
MAVKGATVDDLAECDGAEVDVARWFMNRDAPLDGLLVGLVSTGPAGQKRQVVRRELALTDDAHKNSFPLKGL